MSEFGGIDQVHGHGNEGSGHQGHGEHTLTNQQLRDKLWKQLE